MLFCHCENLQSASVQIRGNPKVNLRLNSWILRYAQYDKIYDTKSVWYDKIYKYDRQVSMTYLGLCLNFCDKICLNFIVDCHANFCKICSQ